MARGDTSGESRDGLIKNSSLSECFLESDGDPGTPATGARSPRFSGRIYNKGKYIGTFIYRNIQEMYRNIHIL